MKKESFAFRLRAWFNNLPIQDPVERRMASLLQVILIGLIVTVLFATMVLMAVPSLDTKEKLDALTGNFFGLLVVALPLSLLRRGYFRSSVLIIITILFITPALAVTVVFDLPNSGGILIQFTLAILLSGLLVNRRALALVFGLSAALVAFSAFQGQSAEPRLARLSMETAINFILFNGLIALFLDRFGITLRTALTDALARETELQSEITERGQAETALSLTEQRSRALIESSWDAIALFGADGTILYGSPSTPQILGYSLEEFVGRNAFELIHEGDQALVTERLTLSLQQPGAHVPVYARVRHKNGEWRWLEGVFTNLLDEPSVQAIVNNYHDFTKRKQDEDALRASEAHKSAILESALDCIITIDHQGYILEFNPAAESTFGYTRAEAVGKEMAELIIPPSLRERHRRGLANYLATGEGPVLEKRIELIGMRADGAEFPVELTITRINGEGTPVFTGFLRDITERKRAEEMIKGSEEHFRLIVEAAPSAIIAVDGDGKMKLVNAQAQELFGYRKEELLGHPVEMLIPEHFRSGHVEYRQKILTQPTSRSMNRGRDLFGLHKDGHEVPVEIGLTPYKSSEGLFTLTLIVDITGRKRAEAALQRVNDELEIQVQERTAALSQANTLLQMLLDYMPDHIYFKDAQSRFIRNSKSQAKALGLSDSAEAIGKSDFDFFPHAQLSYEREQEIIRSGKPLVDLEERVVWPDGRETWVSTTKMPLVDQAGQIIGTFGISRDITERKRSESALQKAKLELEAANRELEAFSYSVSHDLRAPLRTIDGFSQALLEDYGKQLPEEAQGHLTRVRSAAQRMAELIDDLLNLSHVTRSQMKLAPVNLSELAQGIAIELQRTHREGNVNISITPNLKTRGDPNLLQVVLVNLLNNAWKFTSKRERAEIQFGSRDENGETIYFVRDNGAGFDMAYSGKLFGAFQRLHGMTEFPGTGIGLATVQRIIHRHGGRVWAEAEVDQGATFFFTLPSLELAKPGGTAPKEEDSIVRRAREII
jgi:PAS domain S-box-containing protein